MSFEEMLGKDAREGGMGGQQYSMGSKPRPNLSRFVLDSDSNARYIELGGFERIVYSPARERYIAALNLTYDAIVTIYNVDSRELCVCRFYDFGAKEIKALDGFLRQMKGPRNLEARIIGFQNSEGAGSAGAIADFIRARGIRLAEADMFGTNIRHVAIDSKLGVGFEVLLENRVYKPGELKNLMTLDQFQKQARG